MLLPELPEYVVVARLQLEGVEPWMVLYVAFDLVVLLRLLADFGEGAVVLLLLAVVALQVIWTLEAV